jgi:hypothetical protein
MHTADVLPTGLALLEPDEAQEWRRRLKRTARPCGCKSGAVAMLVALVAWPIYVVVSGVPTAPLSVLWAVLTYAGVVIGATVAGKLLGIVVGRRRHRRLQRQLARRLAALETGS